MDELQVKVKFEKLKELLLNEKTEQPLQAFLEQNPFMLTGFGGHVHKDIVVSQLPLGAEFKTDFSWLDINSRATIIHLIEIESASLKIFNENGEFSQPYNHAVQQLKDWHLWCNRNQQYLTNLLEPLELSSTYFEIDCMLIGGRRSCLNSPKTKRKYQALHEELPKWAHVQTWDGFVENIPLARYAGSHSDDVRCVSYRDQAYFEKEIEKLS